MREIKFRVWDCHTKEMAGPKGLRIDFDNGVIDHIEFKFSDYGSWGNATRPLDQERYKVMQFTGLTDKDGKEIYEGDILDGHDDGNVEVVWRDGETQFDFADGGNIGAWEMPLRRSIVIGNIYENPELLEAK